MLNKALKAGRELGAELAGIDPASQRRVGLIAVHLQETREPRQRRYRALTGPI
jgi:hypothetical protein